MILGIVAVLSGAGAAQAGETPGRALGPGWVEAALRGSPERFGPLLEKAAERRVQVLVGLPVPAPGRSGEPGAPAERLFQDAFRLDAEYFYPASAIKLCTAVTALATLNRVARPEGRLTRRTPLAYHGLSPGRSRAEKDPTAPGCAITADWELQKMLVVSDNDAFNRLFELSGHRDANELLWKAGLPSVRIWHRLNLLRTVEENRRTPAIDYRPPGVKGWRPLVPERTSDLELAPPDLPGLDVGTAYIDVNGKARIEKPMDFRPKNFVSLMDLQRLLVAIVRPELDAGVGDLGLTEADLRALRDILGKAPADLGQPGWTGPAFDELRFRPTLGGVLRVRARARLEVRGKAGRAYGFHIENAYYRDLETNRSFFLAAAVLVNDDGVMNDGRYDYDKVSGPFFVHLGEVVARSVFGKAKAKAPRRPPRRPSP